MQRQTVRYRPGLLKPWVATSNGVEKQIDKSDINVFVNFKRR